MGYDRKSFSRSSKSTHPTSSGWRPSGAPYRERQGELAAPTIYNGVMYTINGRWTFALDVETGRQIWRTPVRLEPGITRPAFHRGGATIYNGKLFRVTIDNHVLALDMKTGEQLWNQKFADAKDGYYATGGPIVANGVLISGVAGGESTTRGFLDGWDPDTGRNCGAHTIPRPASRVRRGRKTATPGRRRRSDVALRFIRSQLDLVYWGRAMPAVPPNLARRWIACSRTACSRSMKTGERVCYFQYAKRRGDVDATDENVLADIRVGGQLEGDDSDQQERLPVCPGPHNCKLIAAQPYVRSIGRRMSTRRSPGRC
jgi:alcohol dehydrogenase (cytochrome c)